jgi:chromosome segregation ATPase
MAKKKDIIELLEENTRLEENYEKALKINKVLHDEIDELKTTIEKLENEKQELQAVSEETKEDFRRLIQHLNNKYELNFVLNDKLEVMELEF